MISHRDKTKCLERPNRALALRGTFVRITLDSDL